jgi:phage gpG-like protein
MASITINATAINRVAANLSKRAANIPKQNARAMNVITKSIDRDMKRRWLHGAAGVNDLFGKTGATSDRQLATVTGTARKTLVSRVFAHFNKVVGVVGTPLAYVAMHEWGGTVTGNPLLRIPTKFSKKNSGQDRLQGRSARSLGDKAKIWRSRAGNLFIWEVGTARAKAAGRPIPLYLLKPSIKLRARHMFRIALLSARPLIRATFANAVSVIKSGA